MSKDTLGIKQYHASGVPSTHILCNLLFGYSVVFNSWQPSRLSATRLLCPWDFPGKKYWSGLPFPAPGDLPVPGIEPGSPALQADSLLSEPPGKRLMKVN